MYSIESSAVISAIRSSCRTFRAFLDLGDRVVSGGCVAQFRTEHTFSDENLLPVGSVLSRYAQITLNGREVPEKGQEFTLYIYLEDFDTAPGSDPAVRTAYRDLCRYTHRELERFTYVQISHLGRIKDMDGVPLDGVTIPMGKYTAVSVKSEGCLTNVTAYDRLQFSDIPYVPGISFPASSDAVLEDLLPQIGITGRGDTASGNLLTLGREKVLDAQGREVLCSASYAFVIADAPVGKSCREVLGSIAAMSGANAACGRNGEFLTVFMDIGNTAFSEPVHLDEPEISGSDVCISGISCRTDPDHSLTCGRTDGEYAIAFACPYMTQQRLSEIWERIRSLKWRPAEVTERLGDPRHDLGDNKKLYMGENRYNVPILSLRYSFDGGLTAEIESGWNPEEG